MKCYTIEKEVAKKEMSKTVLAIKKKRPSSKYKHSLVRNTNTKDIL